jgi:hypothetical protein
VNHFPPPAVWTCRVYPFHRQQYGRAGCIPFHHHAVVWTCRVYPFPPPPNSIERSGCILPTDSRKNVHGVSLSTAKSMDVQGVPFLPTAVWTCRVYPFLPKAVSVVSQSIACSVDVQDVCILFYLCKVSLKCRNSGMSGMR